VFVTVAEGRTRCFFLKGTNFPLAAVLLEAGRAKSLNP